MTSSSRPPQIFGTSGAPRSMAKPLLPTILFRHSLTLAGVERPKVCFVTTAVGDQPEPIDYFYEMAADNPHLFEASHLALFPQPNHRNIRDHLLAQDVILVMGGSVVNLIAVWRAHGLHEIMRECWQAGVVLTGGSAGSLCWHVGGSTDSFSDDLDPFTDGLGFLPYSNSVHHDADDQPRRAKIREYLEAGILPAGYATENGTGLHYVGTELVDAVTVLEGADAYWIGLDDNGRAVERPLNARRIEYPGEAA